MGRTTGIAWTDCTWNPWIGCQKVSPGCKYCYAEQETANRVSTSRGLPLWGPPGVAQRRMTSDAYWRQPLVWNRMAREQGRRLKVFCGSMMDVMEGWEGQMIDHRGRLLWVSDLGSCMEPQLRGSEPYRMGHARQRLVDLIQATPWLIWQLLTKRPENFSCFGAMGWSRLRSPQVWAMTSVELQEEEGRIHHLSGASLVAGVSAEPLLGPLDLTRRMRDHAIDWVIVGGESGPHARPCWLEWIYDLVQQCRQYGVACFVKQLGANVVDDKGDRVVIADPKGGDISEWPRELQVRQFPGEVQDVPTVHGVSRRGVDAG